MHQILKRFPKASRDGRYRLLKHRSNGLWGNRIDKWHIVDNDSTLCGFHKGKNIGYAFGHSTLKDTYKQLTDLKNCDPCKSCLKKIQKRLSIKEGSNI